MESVNLLVSDLQMPGLSGLELFNRLVARLPSLRVLFISGAASPPTRDDRAQRSGLAGKPFARNVAAKVHQVLS